MVLFASQNIGAVQQNGLLRQFELRIKIMKQIRELRSLLAGLIAQCSLSPKRAPSFTVRVMMYCVP